MAAERATRCHKWDAMSVEVGGSRQEGVVARRQAVRRKEGSTAPLQGPARRLALQTKRLNISELPTAAGCHSTVGGTAGVEGCSVCLR